MLEIIIECALILGGGFIGGAAAVFVLALVDAASDPNYHHHIAQNKPTTKGDADETEPSA